MKKINLFTIAPGAVVLSACASPDAQEKSENQFQVTPVMEIDTLSFTDFVAEIHALQNVEIRARVSGYLENSIVTRKVHH